MFATMPARTATGICFWRIAARILSTASCPCELSHKQTLQHEGPKLAGAPEAAGFHSSQKLLDLLVRFHGNMITSFARNKRLKRSTPRRSAPPSGSAWKSRAPRQVAGVQCERPHREIARPQAICAARAKKVRLPAICCCSWLVSRTSCR